ERDLECAHHALPAAPRLERLRGDGVQIREPPPEFRLGPAFEPALECTPLLLGDLGLAKERMRERTQEEARASDQYRGAPPGTDLIDPAPRIAREMAGAVALVRIDQVESVVRHAGALLRRRLGGADVHPAVD